MKNDKFNQQKYITNFNKKNYVSIGLKLKPELATNFKKYCLDNNISHSEYIEKTLKIISERNISLKK